MLRLVASVIASWLSCLLLGSAVPITSQPSSASAETSGRTAEIQPVAPLVAPSPAKPTTPEVRKPPTIGEALESGVLIVVSIPNQRAYVFKAGNEWGSAPVSTGRRGHDTPEGVFPILQKSVAHRSTLYHDAPMPYMQRLTWGGVALHGGNVSHYRASHGCIRLPHSFARRLYKITSYRSTAVLITRSRVASPTMALMLVGGQSLPIESARVELAGADPPLPAPSDGRIQTIQLAASANPQDAAGLWDELVERQPQLGRLQHQVIPAIVNSLHVYRLRAFGPGAASICRHAARTGMDCFRVPD